MLTRKIIRQICVYVLIAVGVCGCHKEKGTAHLATAYDIYDIGMALAAEMYVSNRITDQQWHRMSALGYRYRATYIALIEVIDAGNRLGGVDGQAAYHSALDAFDNVYIEFIQEMNRLQKVKDERR
jgi:hypothetical protein